MKQLTLLLVLANLGFLAWGLWIAPDETPRPVVASSQESDVARLVLLSELPAEPVEEPQAATVSTPPDVSPASDATISEPIARPPGDAVSETGAQEVNARLVTPEAGADVDENVNAPAVAEPTPVPVEPETAPLVARSSSRCVSLGPFLDLAETAEAAARVRERGYAWSQRLADSPVWVGNWVYVGPFATPEAAIGAAENLRTKGMSDLYVESVDEQQNTVSLGLFSDRQRAETTASAVRKLGVEPQIADRYRVASVYWIDVVVPAGTTLNAADYQRRPGRVVQVQEGQCVVAGAGAEG